MWLIPAFWLLHQLLGGCLLLKFISNIPTPPPCEVIASAKRSCIRMTRLDNRFVFWIYILNPPDLIIRRIQDGNYLCKMPIFCKIYMLPAVTSRHVVGSSSSFSFTLWMIYPGHKMIITITKTIFFVHSESVMGSVLKNLNNVALFLFVFLQNAGISCCDQGEISLNVINTKWQI